MESIKKIAESIPHFKKLCVSQGINPAYAFVAVLAVCYLLIQNTLLGPFLTSLITLYFPIKDGILLLQSPSPKVAELKKLLIVFMLIALLSLVESLYIHKLIPLFVVFKVAFLFWANLDEKNASTCFDLVFNRIPKDFIHSGDSIESAVKKAAESAKAKISVTKDESEVKKE